MKVEELRQCLRQEGIDPAAYDLEGTQRDEVYCLEEIQGGWKYYYRERGLHRGERSFSSEDAACQFLLDRMLRDPTTREGR